MNGYQSLLDKLITYYPLDAEKIDLNFLTRQFWLGSSGAAGAFIPDRNYFAKVKMSFRHRTISAHNNNKTIGTNHSSQLSPHCAYAERLCNVYIQIQIQLSVPQARWQQC